jgi:putative heme transporter
VTVLILASFLVFFLLRDADTAWHWVFQATSDQKRGRIGVAGAAAITRVGAYLRGTTLLAALIALSDLAFMLVLGVPLAGPLAVLVFLAGYIPYFGGIVTTAIILLVTLGALGPGPAAVMLLLVALRNVILAYGVPTAVHPKTVGIHPALVLLAVPVGFELAGIVGLFAAVPVTAVILAVARATVGIVDPVPRPQLPGLVPAWLDRVAQWSWRMLIAVAVVALLVGVFVAVPLVLIPAVLATILAATLEPLVRALIRRGRPRAQAAAIAVGGGFLAVTAVLVLTMVALVGQAGAVREAATSGAASLNAALGGHAELGVQAVANGGSEAVRAVAALAEGLATVAVIAILSTLLAYYFLRDGGRLWERLVSRIRTELALEVSSAGARAFEVLGGYMIGTAAISFVGAASQLVIMVVLGLPLALPVFVLSFILGFVPYIGGFLSTGLAFLITVAVGSPADIVVMAAWTVAFNLVTGNIVSPIVYGRTVHIHPAVVLLAIPAGGAIAGILGMFLVVPAIGVVAATWRTVLSVMASGGSRSGAAGRAPLPSTEAGQATGGGTVQPAVT